MIRLKYGAVGLRAAALVAMAVIAIVVGSATVATFTSSNQEPTHPVLSVQASAPPCGDLNGDGSVNVFDAITLLQIIVGIVIPDATQSTRANLDQSASVDVFDAITLLQVIVGSIAPESVVCGPVATTPPVVDITSPANLSLFNTSPVTVSGTVGLADTVEVNGIAAAVSGGTFSAQVPLKEGNNTLTAVAQNAAGVATDSIQATLDTVPPIVTIDSPPDSFVTNNASINVAGMINDIVVGTVNGDQAQVTVNGLGAQVSNRSYLAADVALTLGPNTITAIGTDKAGNTASTSIIVVLEAVVEEPHINLLSGNNQSGPIGSQLPGPLVVAVTDAAGGAIQGATVIFEITENNGTLSNGPGEARSLAVPTDVDGLAQVRWTLGNRAGAGNNLAEATVVGISGMAIFAATALATAPDKINVDAGNNQTGVAGQPLPSPFVAVVTDAGHNRLGAVPVTFTVVEGGGSFDGQPSLTLNTDSDGRALAVLTLGPDEGFDNNVVDATFQGNPGFPTAFVASGMIAGDPADTSISGVVLDNSDVPIPGVTMRVEGTNLETQTDAEGQFLLLLAPVGHVLLVADGSTAQRPGIWPRLEYDLVTVAGRDNTIGMPIYLLPLNVPNGLFVDETTGGTLTLPEVPGFSLTIEAGSATFPDGAREGIVSVTLVHNDKIPMVPNFGQQPRFIVTIQPSGVLFDPPAPITLPNLDGMAPGEVTELYSFDHDLGQFVSIGTGTVSEDGTIIASDPGVGIIKGGWHCGGNPAQTGVARSASVTVDKTTVNIPVGGSVNVIATGAPLPSGNPAYTWTSQDPSIATVAQPGGTQAHPNTGVFTAVAEGTTIITVTYKCQSGATATAEVEVIVGGVEIQNIPGRDSTDFMPRGYRVAQGDAVDADPTPATIFYKIEPDTLNVTLAELKINGGAIRTITLPNAAGEHQVDWDGKDDAGNFVPTGSYNVVVEVTHNPTIVSNTHQIQVVEVTNVELLTISGDPLENNAHPASPGGLRIFAGRPTPLASLHVTVVVSVSLSTAVPAGQLDIHLKSYDVDDPTGLINANHAVGGVTPVPAEGKLLDDTIDAFKAFIGTELTVTRQPGDNFKVFASINQNLINNLTDALVETHTNAQGATVDASLQPLASDRLTVWRKVHIELDSMGNVAGNSISGKVTGVVNNAPAFPDSDITTDQNFSDVSPNNGDNRFVGGLLRNAGNTFTVVGNSHGPNFNVRVNNLPGGIIPIGGDDVQEIPVGQGLPDQTCVSAGVDGILDTTVLGGDDAIAGGVVTTGANGICETRAVIDDQQIPVGNGLADQNCVTAGADGVLDSTPGGDDVAVGALINTGPDGICDTRAVSDVQVIAIGQGGANLPCVTAGINGVLDSTPGGDDVVAAGSINTGANGICETTAAVGGGALVPLDFQEIPVNEGLADQPCVTPGLNNVLDTGVAGDDIAGGNQITPGPDGVCDSTATGGDVQEIPVAQGAQRQLCITPGSDNLLDTTLGGDDLQVGQYITTGPNGLCESTAANDDVQELPVGSGISEQPCIATGADGTLETAVAGDDVVRGLQVTPGADGVCDTTAAGTDVQEIPVTQGVADRQCVTPGADGVLNTAVTLGDDVSVAGIITTGPNGICETASATILVGVADDVQVLPVGQGAPNLTCVTAGADGILDSPAGGDDVAAADINTGANGICETRAVLDVQVIPVAQGLPNQDCVIAGADGILDTTALGGDDVAGALIDTGANGICETTAVIDLQEIPIGQGEPDQTCVSAGANGVLDTPTPVGDDVIAGNQITTGPNGICETTAADGTFTLVDDDDFNADDGANLDGDDAEDVASPSLNLIQDNDDGTCGDGTCNVFSYAYVRPTYDLGGNTDVSFVLNTPDSAPAAEGEALIGTYEFANKTTEASTTFWTVYLLGAYQMQTEEDCDADSCTGGQVDAINGQGASVFMEAARELRPLLGAGNVLGVVAGHEIAHLFNGRHADGGLVGSPPTSRTFSDVTLRKIRNIDHP